MQTVPLNKLKEGDEFLWGGRGGTVAFISRTSKQVFVAMDGGVEFWLQGWVPVQVDPVALRERRP